MFLRRMHSPYQRKSGSRNTVSSEFLNCTRSSTTISVPQPVSSYRSEVSLWSVEHESPATLSKNGNSCEEPSQICHTSYTTIQLLSKVWLFRNEKDPMSPIFGHTLERAWMVIFGCNDLRIRHQCNDRDISAICGCYDVDK